MKYGVLIAWVLFLSACGGLNQPKPTHAIKPTPEHWSASGRISIQQQNTLENYSFALSVRPDSTQLELGDALGLSKLIARQSQQQLWVNNQPVSQNLQSWLQAQLGWHLSIKDLEKILFNRSIERIGDWQVVISKTQIIANRAFPKIVRLHRLDNSVKIKLLLSDINS